MDILARVRSVTNIGSGTIADNTITAIFMPIAEARYNRVMDDDIEIADDTWTTGEGEDIDLALSYLCASEAAKNEYMHRLIEGADQWYIWEQMAYGIMCEIDPTKIGKRPIGAGGDFYIRREKGIAYDNIYVAEND